MDKEIESLFESFESFEDEPDEPFEYSTNPASQEILKSELKAIEKVTELVNIYLQEYPDFVPIEEQYMHASCLALHHDIKPWLFTQCGGPVELWSLLLAAAKEWFTERNKTKLGQIFCAQFEMEDLTWWNGWEPIQPTLKEYMKWCYNKDV